MAMARFFDRMCLALRASELWLCYAALQNLIPSFPWIAPPRPPPWRHPRKGRDQILPSGKPWPGPGRGNGGNGNESGNENVDVAAAAVTAAEDEERERERETLYR